MTVAPTTATTSDYAISIPITAVVSVYLSDLPSGLSREEIIARLTPDTVYENGELDYPMKDREVYYEAGQTVLHRSDEIDIEEDTYEEGQADCLVLYCLIIYLSNYYD